MRVREDSAFSVINLDKKGKKIVLYFHYTANFYSKLPRWWPRLFLSVRPHWRKYTSFYTLCASSYDTTFRQSFVSTNNTQCKYTESNRFRYDMIVKMYLNLKFDESIYQFDIDVIDHWLYLLLFFLRSFQDEYFKFSFKKLFRFSKTAFANKIFHPKGNESFTNETKNRYFKQNIREGHNKPSKHD